MYKELINYLDYSSTTTPNQDFPNYSYIKKVKSLYKIKTDRRQVNNPELSNLYCDIGSSDLLVIVGESWSYGDSIGTNVKAGMGKEDVAFRISNNFGGRLGIKYNSDVLYITTPGNSNGNVLYDFTTILPHILKEKEYKSIKFSIQLTSFGRDCRGTETFESFKPFTDIILKLKQQVLPLKKWIDKYESTIINKYIEFIQSINIPFKIVFWKNFNSFYTDTDDLATKNVTYIKTNWSEDLFDQLGVKLQYPFNMELDIDFNKMKFIDIKFEELQENIKRFERYVDELGDTPLTGYHPNPSGHWLWAQKISKHFD